MRIPAVAAAVLLAVLAATGPASAQTLVTTTTFAINLKPTAKCPQPEIDQMQKVISFVEGQTWSEHPGSVAFQVEPDTSTCLVVLKINKVASVEQAALERAGAGRLSIEKTKDYAKPSRLPLLLWIVFGGAGVVFVFIRYGRR